MKIYDIDVAVIGGGPAGMAAALAASQSGTRVFLFERNDTLGGILNQCIHDGFGLIRFNEQLTGPEYADRYINLIQENANITVFLNTMVTLVTPELNISFVSRDGLCLCRARSVVFATGCRERTRGAIAIPGFRPAGIFTAGVAQQLMNIDNISIGKRIVILGSGDIGLIMARRLTLEGAEVICVLEKMPYCNGLPRNISQCLQDFNIPLYLNKTVSNINGKEHLESVTVSSVGENGSLITGSEYEIECDTLILSVGLIPENELASVTGILLSPITKGAEVNDCYETSVSGIFMCGNALHVNDLVDTVSEEGEMAGHWAAQYAQGLKSDFKRVQVICREGIRYTVPQQVCGISPVTLSLRAETQGVDKRLVILYDDMVVSNQYFRRINPSQIIKLTLPVFGNEISEIGVMLV